MHGFCDEIFIGKDLARCRLDLAKKWHLVQMRNAVK
jgi:hypothetical protein